MKDIYLVPSASPYDRLSAQIDAMLPRVTQGSTLQFDLNKLLVLRRMAWMKENGLGAARK